MRILPSMILPVWHGGEAVQFGKAESLRAESFFSEGLVWPTGWLGRTESQIPLAMLWAFLAAPAQALDGARNDFFALDYAAR